MYKVMVIAPTPFFADRGCHVRILEEIKALKKKGIEFFVVTYHIGKDIPGTKIYRTIKIPWYNKLEAGPSVHKPYIDLLLLLKACLICRKERPDIIHAHLHEGGWVGKFCSKWYNVPMVLDIQGSMTDELIAHKFLGGRRSVMAFFEMLERKIVNRADAIVVSSQNTADLLVDKFGVMKENVTFVPDGVDLEFIKPVSNKRELRVRLGLPEHKRIFIYAGVLSEYQGIDMLIEAVSTIKELLSDVLFLIIGYPETKYIEMVKNRGVESFFYFTGKVPYNSLPEYVELADIGIAPKVSKTEANGKVLNYMAAGLPVVVFDTPINRFMLGDYGIYAKFKDVKDLAEKLLWVINNMDSSMRLGRMLHRRLVEHFSWDAISERILEVYSRVYRGA